MIQRIGVYVCQCGPNIEDAVDTQALVEAAKDYPHVVHTRSFGFLCSPEGKAFLVKDIQAKDLSRVVVAGCSPKEHEQTFREVLTKAGLNPYLLQIANIREQCAWVIPEKQAATGKALDLLRAAVLRVPSHEPLHKITIECCPDVLVVGAGVAGTSAALAVAGGHRRVYLVEKEPCIGGRVARHEELYPDMACASCLLETRLDEALHHDGIEVLTMTELVAAEGFLGNFRVSVRQKARFVEADACIGCGACFEACPVGVSPPFMGEKAGRKAISIPYAGALPNVAVIDKKTCLRFQGKSCTACFDACPFGAIKYEAPDRISELRVGAIVLATGFQSFDPERDERYGYGKVHNVITSSEFEQLVNSTGPTEGKILLENGEIPRSVAFVHCVGSRTERFNDYCSGVCCPVTLKHARQARRQLPEAEICQFHADLCLSGKDSLRFYQEVKNEDRVQFFRILKPDSVKVRKGFGGVILSHKDSSGMERERQFDLVVLATAMEAPGGTRQIAEILDLKLGKGGFPEGADARMDPVCTAREGIFMAGCVQGPKDISTSVAQGHAAAGRIMGMLQPGAQLELEPMASEIDQEICSGCLICINLCAYQAIELEEGGTSVAVNQALCRACGVCAAGCPSGAVTARHFSTPAVFSELRGLMG